jgi:hypothetical protein
VTQQFVGASVRVPAETEVALRLKEEMLARQRAIEEDRAYMQKIAAEERRLEERRLEERRLEERRLEERRLEEEAARERRKLQEEAQLARERQREAEEAERIRKEAEAAERLRLEEERRQLEREAEAERRRLEREAEAERIRLEKEAEAQRRAEEEAERKRLEQERREQWEREERERQERWERDEAERIRWLLNEKQRMEDERLAQMEAMKEEMRMEFQKQREELETATAAAQFEAEEKAKKRERELQEQRDAELAKQLADETPDPPTPFPARQAPAQTSAPLPSYEELDTAQLSPPPIRHSPSPRSRVLSLPPSPPMFPAPQLPYHDPFQPRPMGFPSGSSSSEGAHTPVPRSPMRQPMDLPPDTPSFRTVSPATNGHVVHGSESFDHTHGQHRPNPSLTRHTVSLGGANPGRAPPPLRIGGLNPHQPRASPPMSAARHLVPEEGLPHGARPPMVHGNPPTVSNGMPNAPSSSVGPSQPLYPPAMQASGSGSASESGAHYGVPPPDGVSGICE